MRCERIFAVIKILHSQVVYINVILTNKNTHALAHVDFLV